MDQKTIEALGDSLTHALVRDAHRAPAERAHPDMTIEDAYHVQQRMIARRLEKGDRVIGKKIGAPARRSSTCWRHQPDFGYLLDSMVFNEGESVTWTRSSSPRPRARSPSCSRKTCRARA